MSSENIKKLVGSVMEQVVPAVKGAISTTVKEVGKEVAKDLAVTGATIAVAKTAEKLKSSDSMMANIAGEAIQNVGDKHLGNGYTTDARQPERLGQLSYEQVKQADQSVAFLDKIESEMEHKPVFKMR